MIGVRRDRSTGTEAAGRDTRRDPADGWRLARRQPGWAGRIGIEVPAGGGLAALNADDFNTVPGTRPDPGGFLPEARTGAREAAAHMKDLAERFAQLRNAVMRLPGNPSRDDRAGLRHRLLHIEDTLMSARGSLDDVIIAIVDANDAAT